MSSARAPAGSRGGNGLATVSPRRDRRAPAGNGRSGLCSLARAASQPPELSPRAGPAALSLSFPRVPGLLADFLGFLGNCRGPSSFAAGTPSCLAFLLGRLPVGRQGCCRGCRAHGCVLGDERQTEVTTREKAVTRQDRSWGSSPGTAPRKASFRDGRGGFLSPAWAPDLVQPHPVSRLLQKLLLLFAWLLSPFLSL